MFQCLISRIRGAAVNKAGLPVMESANKNVNVSTRISLSSLLHQTSNVSWNTIEFLSTEETYFVFALYVNKK